MKKTFEQKIYAWHKFCLHLGPVLGGPIVKAMAYYSLYKIATNGGLESLAFVCYEHMLTIGKQQKEKKINGAQTGMRQKQRP